MTSGPVAAQQVGDADRADLQCLGVFIYMGGQGEDAAAKAWFTGQAQHYLGRLEGRSPGVVWLDRLTDYFAGPFPQEFEAQRARCGPEAEARDDALEAWSVAFMARVAAARSAD
ncbi:hypothetical protein [Brevundimonas sp.]|uniref:hypothetical protein n=1 Tax=Brevundimonas sp. TaxID=1871086 RepID=UPI003BACB471